MSHVLAGLIQRFTARPARAAVVASVALLLVLGSIAAGCHLWALYHFDAGNRLVERQEFAKAYPHYVDCLKIWRWSTPMHLLAGRTARRASMVPEAEHHFTRCVDLQGRDSPAVAAVALERLLIQAQQGDLAEIEEMLWDKIKKDKPEKLLILEALAHGYMRMFRLGPAMRCLRLILESDPDNVEALANRGWVAERTTGPMEAIKDYRRALELRPDRDDVRLRLALIVVKDSAEEAREQFEFLLARQPDNPEVLLGLARAYQAGGDPDRPRALIDQLLHQDPENSRALAEKGVLAIVTGSSSVGEALLRKAIANDPSNLDAQYQLYLCLRQQGREAEADAQRQVHQRFEADRARIAQIIGQEMSKKPFDPDLHYEIGAIYIRNGKPDLGLRWLHNALKLDPNHQPSRQALADYFKHAASAAKPGQGSGPTSAPQSPAQK